MTKNNINRLTPAKLTREVYESLVGRAERCYVTSQGKRERIVKVERFCGSVLVQTNARSFSLTTQDVVTVDAGLMIESRLALAE